MNVTLEPTRLKVKKSFLGRTFERWVDGFYLVINGHRQYPALPADDARKSLKFAIKRLQKV